MRECYKLSRIWKAVYMLATACLSTDIWEHMRHLHPCYLCIYGTEICKKDLASMHESCSMISFIMWVRRDLLLQPETKNNAYIIDPQHDNYANKACYICISMLDAWIWRATSGPGWIIHNCNTILPIFYLLIIFF